MLPILPHRLASMDITYLSCPQQVFLILTTGSRLTWYSRNSATVLLIMYPTALELILIPTLGAHLNRRMLRCKCLGWGQAIRSSPISRETWVPENISTRTV